MKTITAILIILLILAGCTQNAEESAITIGGIFHLTGPGASWGTAEKNAAILAVQDINEKGGINGTPITLVIEDGMTDFTKTATTLQKLKDEHINIIIGPTWSGNVASTFAKEEKIIAISPSAGVVTDPSQYFFTLWLTEEQATEKIVKAMKKEGIKTVFVIYSQNEWSLSMYQQFAQQAKEGGIAVVQTEATEPLESDFRTIIEKIKQKNPDAVYIPFAFYPPQGSFMRQFKTQGLKMPIYSTENTESPPLVETAGAYLDGTIYYYPAATEKDLIFQQRYKEIYGELPSSGSASYAYDAVMLVAEALKDGKRTPEEIQKWLHEASYEGLSGTIEFDENGRIRAKELLMKRVENETFSIIG